MLFNIIVRASLIILIGAFLVPGTFMFLALPLTVRAQACRFRGQVNATRWYIAGATSLAVCALLYAIFFSNSFIVFLAQNVFPIQLPKYPAMRASIAKHTHFQVQVRPLSVDGARIDESIEVTALLDQEPTPRGCSLHISDLTPAIRASGFEISEPAVNTRGLLDIGHYSKGGCFVSWAWTLIPHQAGRFRLYATLADKLKARDPLELFLPFELDVSNTGSTATALQAASPYTAGVVTGVSAYLLQLFVRRRSKNRREVHLPDRAA